MIALAGGSRVSGGDRHGSFSSVKYRTWKGGGKTGCPDLLQVVHKM